MCALPRSASLRFIVFLTASRTLTCARSGVEADLEDDNKVVDTSFADQIKWTPSSRGEAGQTPRDKEVGPLSQYCADLYQVTRRT